MVIAIAVEDVESHASENLIEVALVRADVLHDLKEMHIVEIGDTVRRLEEERERYNMHREAWIVKFPCRIDSPDVGI